MSDQQYDAARVLEALASHEGAYSGTGVNHEGEPFRGTMSIETRLGHRAIRVLFKAESMDAQNVFHQEETMISTTPAGELRLWTVSNNMPGVLEHHLHAADGPDQGGDVLLVFRCGDFGDELSFRHQLTLKASGEGLRYSFAWGLPGGPFADRSSVELVRDTKTP